MPITDELSRSSVEREKYEEFTMIFEDFSKSGSTDCCDRKRLLSSRATQHALTPPFPSVSVSLFHLIAGSIFKDMQYKSTLCCMVLIEWHDMTE